MSDRKLGESHFAERSIRADDKINFQHFARNNSEKENEEKVQEKLIFRISALVGQPGRRGGKCLSNW